MKQLPFAILSVGTLALSATAQQSSSSQPRPITAPVRYAGTYHLATGTWTGGGSLAAPAGNTAAVIYDNTCPTGYYASFVTGATAIDEGRLPSPSSHVIPNAWGLGNDSEYGLRASYSIDGFGFAYCTAENSPRSFTIDFYEAYNTCTAPAGAPMASFPLTGLPASSAAGALACWSVDIDLCGSGQSFVMQADADGIWNHVPYGFGDTFGWAFTVVTPSPHGMDGPIIAGGRVVNGSYQTCSGSDGTVFDTGTVSAAYPANAAAINLGCGSSTAGSAPEAGSGMGSQDSIFLIGAFGGGCWWFGGTVPANFELKLYSTDLNSSQVLCEPGSGGVIACPCSNPPSGPGRGCDNSAGTGGASMTSFGLSVLGSDTLVFTTQDQRPIGLTVLVQGTTVVASGAGFGQGVSCVGGVLKRLYIHQAVGGSMTAPGPGEPPVSVRSFQLGNTILQGQHRYYIAYYRDPIVLGGCPASATFNATSGCGVLWY